MTTTEWKQVVMRMVANWPNAKPPKISLAKWYDDLQDLPAEQVIVAVESLYREGKEFAPNGGQIRKRVVELGQDSPEWGEVWRKLLDAVARFSHDRQPEANQWLADWHPLAGDFAVLMDWREFRFSESAVSTKEAQLRGKWNGLVERAQRDEVLRGLPSAGLRALERSNGGLRKLGFKEIGGAHGATDGGASEGQPNQDTQSQDQAQPEVGNTLETSSR